MELIVTKTLEEKELEPLKNVINLEILKNAAKKSIEGLGESIKTAVKIPETLLKKVYLTTSGGAARSIFLLKIKEDKTVLVMIRMKNDKKVGVNMTINNPKFKKALEKNLEGILKDLALGNYKKITL